MLAEVIEDTIKAADLIEASDGVMWEQNDGELHRMESKQLEA